MLKLLYRTRCIYKLNYKLIRAHLRNLRKIKSVEKYIISCKGYNIWGKANRSIKKFLAWRRIKAYIIKQSRKSRSYSKVFITFWGIN